MRGFADLHNHQFAYLGFGGKAFHGRAFGDMKTALPWCDFVNGDRFNPIHGAGGTLDIMLNFLKQSDGSGHLVGGYPQFDGWPRWDSISHQSVYEDWLYRAVEGGLRLMVMLAVNNEFFCSKSNRVLSCNDMEAVDRQIATAKEMEVYIDEKSGGPGQGWYRIVYSPAHARAVIEAGKLAVVLGIEVDYLFNCRKNGDLSEDQLRERLDTYYAIGVRHLFPIHFGNNGFGGTAFQNPLEWAQRAERPGDSDHGISPLNPGGTLTVYEVLTEDGRNSGYEYRTGRRNVQGLTDLGKSLIREVIARGMIIDVDHMSARTKADTLDICEEVNYPVVSGHTGFVEISRGKKRHEGQLLAEEVERIRKLGGMLAVILHQGKLDEITTWEGPGQPVIAHTCGDTSNTFVQAYLYAASKMKGAPVAFGTDFNGLAGLPRPRRGKDRPEECQRHSHGAAVTYPFIAAATGQPMDRSVVGQKTFDVNVDGPAHVGMLPDFIADLETMGLSLADLEPLLNSAEGYVRVWERAIAHGMAFDVQFYLNYYPDLKAAFGTDYSAALDHWVRQGRPNEGRRGSLEFAVQFYLNHYQDLKEAFGTDYSAALDHWVKQGFPHEGRRGSREFDVQFYLKHYQDLKEAFGTDYSRALDHWVKQGFPHEGRRGSLEFDVQFYLNHYDDLKQTFGTDYSAAFDHWLTTGLPQEGRRGSPEFDVQFYLNNNADLKASFGTDYSAALDHWINRGISEGRKAVPLPWQEQLGSERIASGPGVCSWATGRLDVFVKGTDNTLWHKWYDGAWSGYEQLGPDPITSDPAAVSWGNGRIDVFVRGTNNRLWHKWYDGRWSDYEQLGPEPITSGPGVCSWATGRLDVFVRGTDNTLWHKWYDGAWFAGYAQLGTEPIASDPAAVSWGNGRIDVFVRGADSTLWHRWYDGGRWSGYEQLGTEPIASGPGVCSLGAGRLNVFARGTDNTLWHKWYDGGWSDWESEGGGLTSDPAAVSWGKERIDVFARGSNNALYHNSYG